MEDHSQDTKVEVPQKEATNLLSELRKQLPTVPVSVSAAINRNGIRVLEVQCDHPEDSQVWCNFNYRADKPLDKIVAHAVKRIRIEFDL